MQGEPCVRCTIQYAAEPAPAKVPPNPEPPRFERRAGSVIEAFQMLRRHVYYKGFFAGKGKYCKGDDARMEPSLESIIELLEDVNEGPDYANSTTLIDNTEIDSFGILAIISALDEEYGVSVPAKDVIPANFNSAQAIYELVQRLLEED